MGTAGRSLTVAQAHRLVEELSFSQDRLAAVTALRPLIVDPQAAAALLDLFPFSTDKAKVEALFR
jgi:predicted DNA-binding helix-hairpin-helix protein